MHRRKKPLSSEVQKKELYLKTSVCLCREREMASIVTTVRNAEKLVERTMKGNDASHDAAHVWRVRDLALSLAQEEGLSSDSMEIVKPFKLNLSLYF